MNISIIVVAYNEENNIADCLNSLVSQNYAYGTYEIIVVDGLSEDSTPKIVEEYCHRYSNITLVTNPKRTISSNRNVGIHTSAYPFIAFTDADCICPSHWIAQLASKYQQLSSSRSKVGAVGGGNTAEDQFGSVTESIAIAFDSYISAMGSVQSKLLGQIQKVESLACLNVLYNKKALEEVGSFDEGLRNLGEDWDLNFRLRQQGYNLFYIPTATVIHKMRSTIPSFLKQMYQYGVGRANLIKKHKTINIRYLTPILFLIIMVSFPIIYFISSLKFFLISLIYFPTIILYSMILCNKKSRFNLSPLVSLIFFIIHFSYSIGELKGLISRKKGESL
jgi:succinoglycan biosynthesis protein ExoA